MGQPMEFVVKPKVIYMLIEATSPLRRIYTDGRAWPKDPDRSYAGYSIGKWLDTDNDGTYDTLEIETRDMTGLRLMANTGIPLASDAGTVVKDKPSLDNADPALMHNELTPIDQAFTHWTVSRIYKRVHDGRPQEDNWRRGNRLVRLAT